MSPDKISFISQQWMDLAPQIMRRMRVHVIEAAVGTLTMPQYRILANINRGLNSVGAIATHHGITQPSMSKMINLMIERGLIERQPHSTDKRQSVLFLTVEGRRLFLKVRHKAQKKLSEKLRGLKQSDLAKLNKSFDDIGKVLKNWKL
jgi:DNA-binding MarR family transcriptional regulator